MIRHLRSLAGPESSLKDVGKSAELPLGVLSFSARSSSIVETVAASVPPKIVDGNCMIYATFPSSNGATALDSDDQNYLSSLSNFSNTTNLGTSKISSFVSGKGDVNFMRASATTNNIAAVTFTTAKAARLFGVYGSFSVTNVTVPSVEGFGVLFLVGARTVAETVPPSGLGIDLVGTLSMSPNLRLSAYFWRPEPGGLGVLPETTWGLSASNIAGFVNVFQLG